MGMVGTGYCVCHGRHHEEHRDQTLSGPEGYESVRELVMYCHYCREWCTERTPCHRGFLGRIHRTAVRVFMLADTGMDESHPAAWTEALQDLGAALMLTGEGVTDEDVD